MNVRSIATAYGTGLLNVFSSLLANIWLLGIVTRDVDKPTLGLYLLITSSAGYLGLLQLSLDFAAGQRIAIALAKNDPMTAARLVGQTAWFNRILASMILAATVLAVIVILTTVDDPQRGRFLSSLLSLVGLTQVIICLSRPVVAGLTGSQNIATVQIVRVVFYIASTVLAFALIKAGVGVLSLAIAEVGMQAAMWFSLGRIFSSRCSWSQLAVTNLRTGLGELIRYGAVVSVTSLVNYACLNCEPFLLLLAETARQSTAEYYIWARFPQLFYSMNFLLFAAVSPAVAAAYATSEAAGHNAFAKVSRAIAVMTLAGMLGLGLWLNPVVHVWTGGRYDLANGIWVATAMAVGVGARNLIAAYSLPFYATNRVRTVTLAHTAQLAVKVALGIVLVPISPVLGVAMADAVSAIVSIFVLCLALQRNRDATIRTLAVPLLLLALVSVAIAVGVQVTADFELWSTVTGIAGTAACLAVILALWLRWTGLLQKLMRKNPPRTTDANPTSDEESR
jgi:O-antigen/teichoic acid export membrane protein